MLIGAAVGAAIVYAVGAIALGSPPEVDDSGGAVVAWFSGHAGAARTYAWTATLGTLLFAVYAALVRVVLPRPHRDVWLIGATVFIAENAIQGWLWAGLALHPDSLEPGAARTLLDVASFWGPVLTGATTAMIGAVTALGFGREPLVPRWLTILGALAFVEQLAETVTVFGTGGFIAPGGDMNLVLGAGLSLLWLVGLTVWAAGRLPTEDGAQTAAGPS
jgi:hypothetical protein